jgi:hypothetical protein
MNREKFDAHVAAMTMNTSDLLIRKGAEYAGDADRLANFKRNAAKNQQTVLECWQVYIGKHIDSINSYVARVKNEAVRMTLVEIALGAQTISSVDSASSESDKNSYKEKVDAMTSPERFRDRVNHFVPIAMRNIDRELSEPIHGRFEDIINYCFLGSAIIAETQEEQRIKDRE